MTSTPTLSRGTVSPVGSVSEAWPVDVCTWSATCDSTARRLRLTQLCDALSSTNIFARRSATTFPSALRSGRSTSHRYLGLVVPFAVTIISVELARTLSLTAKAMSVMQCMPAPVSPSHMAFAQ
eukprot:4016633-Pleurochrysis_carterae.AAC.1